MKMKFWEHIDKSPLTFAYSFTIHIPPSIMCVQYIGGYPEYIESL